jgi:hypothetical protein
MRVMRTAGCLAFCSFTACTGMGSTRPDLKPWPEIRSDFRVETLRARMFEYSITFAAEVDLAASSIERQTTDPMVRRNALLWKIRAVPEMRKACFRLEPVSGLVDAWTFARQMDQLFTDGAGSEAFGPFQNDAVAVSRRMVEQLRQIGGSIAESPEARAAFEQRIIEPWLAEHPLRDLTFVRESPVSRFAEQSRDLGGVSQSVGTMEELAINLSQQLRVYLADMPRHVQGEVELVRSDLLSSPGVVAAQGDLHLTAGAVDRIASTGETIKPLIENERTIILEETNRQRALVMDALSLERERAISAVIGAFAEERTELLRNAEAQRLATLEWASAERREAIAALSHDLAGAVTALRGERAIVVDDLRDIVDMVLMRMALFLIAGVVLAPVVAHIYARVWPRRRS